MTTKYNLIGQKFNRLTVIKRMPNSKWREAMWLCRCDCGKETTLRSTALIKGYIKSCGCISLERVIKMGHNNKKYNSYDLSGEFGIGYTSKGEEFYFDLEDYDLIKDYCWHKSKRGYIESREKIIKP